MPDAIAHTESCIDHARYYCANEPIHEESYNTYHVALDAWLSRDMDEATYLAARAVWDDALARFDVVDSMYRISMEFCPASHED